MCGFWNLARHKILIGFDEHNYRIGSQSLKLDWPSLIKFDIHFSLEVGRNSVRQHEHTDKSQLDISKCIRLILNIRLSRKQQQKKKREKIIKLFLAGIFFWQVVVLVTILLRKTISHKERRFKEFIS